MSAVVLLIRLDPELLFIIWVSLKVSGLSTLIAAVVDIPAGLLLAQVIFPGNRDCRCLARWGEYAQPDFDTPSLK